MAIPRPDCVANLRQGSMSSRARSVSTGRPRARARRIWSLRPKYRWGKKQARTAEMRFLRLTQSAEVVLGQRRER